MADPNTRQEKRTPVTLKIKFKSETLEQFIERYAVDVSQGGIFIRTKEPLAVGTQMRFEFQLKDTSPLLGGEGTVVWTRENDPSRPAIAPGMGVRFDKLAEGSQAVLERILSDKAKQAPVRPGSESPTKPPMFTDTPTVVAPANVQEALLGDSPSPRKRSDSGKTPLPKPMPFHSDADEFPEEAFEEATKVRALDELIAATAENGENGDAGERTVAGVMPEPDEEDLAQRARTAQVADRAATATAVDQEPVADRESAPVLPSPPSVEPRVADKPVADEAPASALAAAGDDAPKTRLGIEPHKASTRADSQSSSASAATAKDVPARPAAEPPAKKLPAAPAQKSSMAPMIILLLLLVAGGGAAVWFLVLRPKAEEASSTKPVAKPNDGSGANAVANGSNTEPPKPDTGSAGSAESPTPTNGSAETPTTGSGSDAVAATGSGAGSSETPTPDAGSASTPPKSDVVETYVGSSVKGARVEISGTSFAGAAPLRAKLQRGHAYRARVSAPGYVTQEIAFKGGDRPTARLEPKPRSISIASEPAGAMIFIDNANSGFTTPYTLELKGAQLAKKSVRITLRKNGHKTVDKVVDLAAYKDDGTKMTAAISEQLPVPSAAPPPTPKPSGAGSDATTTPAPSPAPTGGGGGGGDSPPAGDGPKEPNGVAPKEPEPDFLK